MSRLAALRVVNGSCTCARFLTLQRWWGCVKTKWEGHEGLHWPISYHASLTSTTANLAVSRRVEESWPVRSSRLTKHVHNSSRRWYCPATAATARVYATQRFSSAPQLCLFLYWSASTHIATDDQRAINNVFSESALPAFSAAAAARPWWCQLWWQLLLQ